MLGQAGEALGGSTGDALARRGRLRDLLARLLQRQPGERVHEPVRLRVDGVHADGVEDRVVDLDLAGEHPGVALAGGFHPALQLAFGKDAEEGVRRGADGPRLELVGLGADAGGIRQADRFRRLPRSGGHNVDRHLRGIEDVACRLQGADADVHGALLQPAAKLCRPGAADVHLRAGRVVGVLGRRDEERRVQLERRLRADGRLVLGDAGALEEVLLDHAAELAVGRRRRHPPVVGTLRLRVLAVGLRGDGFRRPVRDGARRGVALDDVADLRREERRERRGAIQVRLAEALDRPPRLHLRLHVVEPAELLVLDGGGEHLVLQRAEVGQRRRRAESARRLLLDRLRPLGVRRLARLRRGALGGDLEGVVVREDVGGRGRRGGRLQRLVVGEDVGRRRLRRDRAGHYFPPRLEAATFDNSAAPFSAMNWSSCACG